MDAKWEGLAGETPAVRGVPEGGLQLGAAGLARKVKFAKAGADGWEVLPLFRLEVSH